MTKEEAIEWYKSIPKGTYKERKEYLDKFGAGEIAKNMWNDNTFTYGIEYGILIAIAKIFDLELVDLG